MKNGVESCHDHTPKGSDHGEVNTDPVSWMNKIRARIAFVTIEPFLFCYFLPSYISALSVQNLKFDKACRAELKYTEDKCSDDNVMTVTQSMVNDLTTWQGHLQIAIPAITILFIAAWSDHTGNRKALMLMPMLGKLVSHFGLCLTTYFFDEWSLFVTGLIEVLPTALSGGYHIAIMGSFCHLAEVTPLETRTFRIGIAGLVISLCTPIATFLRQKLRNIAGYYGIFGLSCSLNVLGLLYTYFRIYDVKPIRIEAPWQKKMINFVNPSNAWSSLSIAFNSGPDRVKILLVITAHIVINGPISGTGVIFYRYMTHKYEMEDEIVWFYDYILLVDASGTFIAAILFSKYLKMHDAILGVIVTASISMRRCMYALAPNTLWLYFAPILGIIGYSWGTVIKSLRLKIVAPEQTAKLYSVITVVEATTPLIYRPMYTKIYKYTEDTLPGAVFLLAAAMTVPAMLIFLVLHMQMKKEGRNRVPQSKELYADDNYITSL